MKKLLAFLLIPFCLLICGCTQNADDATNLPPDTYTGSELSEEKELEIRQAFFNINQKRIENFEDVEITDFYGAYNGAYVLFIDAKFLYACMIEYDRIEDTVFWYGSSHKLTVYHDGAFYKLPQAYEEGLLTLEDVHSVSEGRRAISSYSSYIISELSEEKELEIRQAYLNHLGPDSGKTLEEIPSPLLYGVFNGAYAVYFGEQKITWGAYFGAHEKIEDYSFDYPGEEKIIVYKDGVFCSLPEAYETELLTRKDIIYLCGLHDYFFSCWL